MDRGTRKGETRIHPLGGGSESEKEWIAEPEKGGSKFTKKVNPGFTFLEPQSVPFLVRDSIVCDEAV